MTQPCTTTITFHYTQTHPTIPMSVLLTTGLDLSSLLANFTTYREI